MQIETLKVGPLKANCYILSINNEVLLIDPGADYEKIIKVIGDRKIKAILITHSHSDHIGALPMFKNIDIYSFKTKKEGEYQIEPFTFKMIHNPGHSYDSVSYYFPKENILISGDFIFYENIGRCDLPTGNINDMQKSINMIKKYPQDMIIYPGHDRPTTLEHEIKNNIYFKE